MTVTIENMISDRKLTCSHVTRAFDDGKCGGVKVYKKDKDGTTSYCFYPGFYITGVEEETGGIK